MLCVKSYVYFSLNRISCSIHCITRSTLILTPSLCDCQHRRSGAYYSLLYFSLILVNASLQVLTWSTWMQILFPIIFINLVFHDKLNYSLCNINLKKSFIEDFERHAIDSLSQQEQFEFSTVWTWSDWLVIVRGKNYFKRSCGSAQQ